MKDKFLIAGHSTNSPGATGWNGISEHTYTVNLQRKIARSFRILQRYGRVINLQGSIITDPSCKSLSEVIKKINELSQPGDYGIDIHFNPNIPGASGTEVFVHPNTSRGNKKRATALVNETSRILNIPVRRATLRRDYKYPAESHLGYLAILSQTTIPMIVWEVCFMTESDLSKFLGREFTIAHMVVEQCL